MPVCPPPSHSTSHSRSPSGFFQHTPAQHSVHEHRPSISSSSSSNSSSSPFPLAPHLPNTASPQSSDPAMAAATVGMQPSPIHNSGREEPPRQDLPRPYQCPLCDKAFHRLEHQTRHIRTHTGEKPHGCSYPGCTKRFSRSDELTRHSRIHTNPNSRRGNKTQSSAVAQAAAAAYAHHGPDSSMAPMGPPMSRNYPRSAPNSNMPSPNVSPPSQYSSGYNSQPSSYGGSSRSGYASPHNLMPEQPIQLLAHAATQVQMQNGHYPSDHLAPAINSPLRGPPGTSVPLVPHHNSGGLPSASLSAYAYSSRSTSNSHPRDEEDPYGPRPSKRSRPGSPLSTAPGSPTHSAYESHAYTSGHTPVITPSHSPRLRPNGVRLPGIEDLNISSKRNSAQYQHYPQQYHSHSQHQTPTPEGPSSFPSTSHLGTLEPIADSTTNTSHTNSVNSSHNGSMNMSSSAPSSTGHLHQNPAYSRSTSNSTMRISDIISHSGDSKSGSLRTLPALGPSGSDTNYLESDLRRKRGRSGASSSSKPSSIGQLLNADRSEAMDAS